MTGRLRLALGSLSVALAAAGLWQAARETATRPAAAPALRSTDAAPAAPAPLFAPALPATDAAPDPERQLTDRLRSAVDADPEAALALAAEAERRHPTGRLGDERALLEMRALVNLGRIARARDRAREFYEHFPGSPWGEHVYRLTGLHPPPSPPDRPR